MCVSADIDFSTKLPLTWIFVSLSICSVSRCPIGHLDTEQIEMPFGGQTRVGPRNHALHVHGSRIPQR